MKRYNGAVLLKWLSSDSRWPTELTKSFCGYSDQGFAEQWLGGTLMFNALDPHFVATLHSNPLAKFAGISMKRLMLF